jgi:stage III sporulation protein AB
MLWLKTMGICLTIAGFGVWGLNGARRYSRRLAQLKDLRLALGFLEKEIIYMHTPLTRAMERTARFAQPPYISPCRNFGQTGAMLKIKNGTNHDK